MVGQTFSHYKIIKELGRGGMGVVYLAEDTELDRPVAIKIATDASGPRGQQLRIRFRRELKVIAKLSHRNIAIVHDGGKTPEGQLYIVMELVKGKMLGDLIEEGSLTLQRAVEIVLAVAEALAEAHRRGIIHRDIKPSNIAINEQGDVKVLDFGLAKYLDDAAAANQPDENSINNGINEDGHPNATRDGDLARHPDPLPATRTSTGVIVCTPEYASPEQAMGLEVDARTDLFSLGSVLYECITGTRPFSGSKADDVRAKVIRDDPPPPSTLNSLVSTQLDRITLKALAKKPEARYQSARELILDLVATKRSLQPTEKDPKIRTSTDTTPSTTSWPTPQTPDRSTIRTTVTKTRIPVLYVVVALMIVGLVSWGAWRLLRTKPHQPSAAAQRLYDRAVDAMHEGAFFRASKMLEQAVQEDDRFALAHARLGEALTELDYSDQAKDHLLLAHELIPDPSILPYLDSLRFQAVTAVVKRDFAKALTGYQALVEAVPDLEKQHALTDLGRAYEKNDQPDKAIESYQAAIKKDPNYAAALLRLGVVYGRRQRLTEATAAFDQAYKLFNINGDLEGIAEVALQRAVLLTQQGKVAEAGEQLLKALEKASALENQDKSIKVLLNLSNNSIVAGRAEEAQQYSMQAILLAQNNKMEHLTTQGLIDIGNSYMLKANYFEAEKNFNEALRLAQLYKGGRSEARALLSLGSLRTHQYHSYALRQA